DPASLVDCSPAASSGTTGGRTAGPTRTTRSAPSAPPTARPRPVARPTPRVSSSRRSVLRPSSPTRLSASVSVSSSSRTERRVSLHFLLYSSTKNWTHEDLDSQSPLSSPTTVASTSSTRARPREISPVSASRSSRSLVSVSSPSGRRRRRRSASPLSYPGIPVP
ncbi:SPOSA6832_05099, partial [Sporobolomyces salmonicolor]